MGSIGSNATNLLEIEEEKRTSFLKKYRIFDSTSEDSFEHIVELAAKVIGVPMAFISITANNQIWLKGRFGFSDSIESSLKSEFLSFPVPKENHFIVEDATNDSRLKDNYLVNGPFHLRFYASIPLKLSKGIIIGNLCLIDKKAKKLQFNQLDLLKDFAKIVVDQIEWRIEKEKKTTKIKELIHSTAHDLRNPLTLITLQSQLIQQEKNDPEAVEQMSISLVKTSIKMNQIIDEILLNAAKEEGHPKLILKEVSLKKILENVVAQNYAAAHNKDQTILFPDGDPLIITGDELKLFQVFDNILNNAIKYTYAHKNIFIQLEKEDGYAIVRIKDEGQGLTEADQRLLFKRFTLLSAQPTNNEESTGLGLFIAKGIVEAHRGRILAESDGPDKGTTFSLIFPLPTS